MTRYIPRVFKEPRTPVGTVAELFAGVGGFRIGLAAAGWKTVYSNQWEPSTKRQHASEVYEARFGLSGHSNVDIARVEKIPEVFDLLVGGFPCQDYSVAKSLNSAAGLVGKKGVLWWEIHRLVSIHKPEFIFLENVDRLLKSPAAQRGRDFAVMLKTLGDLGYVIEWRAASSADYGAPQRRIRVFIVARRAEVSLDEQSARETVLSEGVLPRALPVKAKDNRVCEIPLEDSADAISSSFNLSGRKSPFENSGVYAGSTAFTLSTSPDYEGERLTLGDILVPDSEVPNDYWVTQEKLKDWEYLKGAKSIPRTHKATGVTYNYAEGKMAFPDLLSNPSRTILTGEGGSTPSRFKHIVKTETGFRRLLPIELERLNGFPDDWTQTGSDGAPVTDARRAFFMGNALVISMVERVGAILAEEKEKLK